LKRIHIDEKEKTASPRELDITNKGFAVPKLAGFEYLEGPECLQRAARVLKD